MFWVYLESFVVIFFCLDLGSAPCAAHLLIPCVCVCVCVCVCMHAWVYASLCVKKRWGTVCWHVTHVTRVTKLRTCTQVVSAIIMHMRLSARPGWLSRISVWSGLVSAAGLIVTSTVPLQADIMEILAKPRHERRCDTCMYVWLRGACSAAAWAKMWYMYVCMYVCMVRRQKEIVNFWDVFVCLLHYGDICQATALVKVYDICMIWCIRLIHKLLQ